MHHHRREVDEMKADSRNEVVLEGIPLGPAELSHENHGQRFYRQLLQVPRLSGTPDTLPLLLRKPAGPCGWPVSCVPSTTAAVPAGGWC